ncbi:MAG: flavin reductase family protein, partial [Rhizobiales bacterium]|nr:flavin reductase family protein [Hyphomicrobiales bacterium]
LGVFDCAVTDVVERENTTVVFGRVVDWLTRGNGDPLIYFRGKYLA